MMSDRGDPKTKRSLLQNSQSAVWHVDGSMPTHYSYGNVDDDQFVSEAAVSGNDGLMAGPGAKKIKK